MLQARIHFQHTCALRRSSRNWNVKIKNVILQFLWHSSINVCLQLKCGNSEMWYVLHQQQHKSFIYHCLLNYEQLTSEYISNKINNYLGLSIVTIDLFISNVARSSSQISTLFMAGFAINFLALFLVRTILKSLYFLTSSHVLPKVQIYNE